MVSKIYIEEQETEKKDFCVCPKCGHKVPKNETTPCPKYKCTKCGQKMMEQKREQKRDKSGNPCPLKKESYEIQLENGNEKEDDKEEDEKENEKPTSKKDDKEIKTKLFDFFSKNPSPKDEKVHEFAESLGMKPDDLESHIYKIIGSFIGAGRSVGFKGEYDPKELEMGIKVEMEHTSDPMLSEKTAKDHLAEIKNYYTRLKKMEAEAGVKD
jgi:hypothetical protein